MATTRQSDQSAQEASSGPARLQAHVLHWRDGAGQTVEIRNPADTRELIALAPLNETALVEEAVANAKRAAASWAQTPAVERGAVLARAAEVMAPRREEIAAAMTLEMGKIISESRAEVERTLEVLRFFSQAPKLQDGSTFPLASSDEAAFTLRVPLGVVGLITPWNFPLVIPARKAAAALAFGNAVVLKPAELSPLSAVALVEALFEAGLPSDVLSLVFGSGPDLGAALVQSPNVNGISFTGSTAVGNEIARSVAGTPTEVQCEMGGRNAIVVMADADIELALETVLQAGFGTSGQRCTSSSRVIVERSISDRFVESLSAATLSLSVGPGLDPKNDVGPLVSAPQLERVLNALDRAVEEGARVVIGGERLRDGIHAHGHFVQPTVMRVPEDSWFAGHEVFGPVVSVFEADDFDHAVRLNNGVDYGLSSAIFTRNLEHALRFVRETDTGMVYVNKPTTGAEPHIPLSGSKGSSIGPPEMGDAWQFYTKCRSAHVRWR